MEKKKIVNLRIPDYLRNALVEEARERGVPQNEILLDAIDQGIASYHGQNKVPDGYTYTCARIPFDIHDKVQDIAKSEFTTVTGMVALFLRSYLEDESCVAEKTGE